MHTSSEHWILESLQSFNVNMQVDGMHSASLQHPKYLLNATCVSSFVFLACCQRST
jgi:hypothetical protein